MSVNLFPHLAGAEFSPCRRWRYRLWRIWDDGLPLYCWIMCNPSVADEVELDRTLRKVLGFTTRWGGGGFIVINLFGLVSTDPRGLLEVDDPVGPGNDAAIDEVLREPGVEEVIAAWGLVGGRYRDRVSAVAERRRRTWSCLRKTKDQHPEHPLYIPYTQRLQRWP